MISDQKLLPNWDNGLSGLPNSSYFVDRKRADNDFETDLEAGHTFEIFN